MDICICQFGGYDFCPHCLGSGVINNGTDKYIRVIPKEVKKVVEKPRVKVDQAIARDTKYLQTFKDIWPSTTELRQAISYIGQMKSAWEKYKSSITSGEDIRKVEAHLDSLEQGRLWLQTWLQKRLNKQPKLFQWERPVNPKPKVPISTKTVNKTQKQNFKKDTRTSNGATLGDKYSGYFSLLKQQMAYQNSIHK